MKNEKCFGTQRTRKLPKGIQRFYLTTKGAKKRETNQSFLFRVFRVFRG